MRINHVIRTLVLGDFFINAGFSVFGPVVAIFVTQQISGGSLEVIGFAAAITQVVKVLFEIPVAYVLDKDHGEYDDFFSMIFGTFIIAFVPFLYLIAHTPTHLYLISALYGIGVAFTVPPWSAIFSRHLDKSHENVEYSLESVSIGIAAGIASAAGGFISQHYGFNFVFVIAGGLAIIGGIVQIQIYGDIRAKVPKGKVKVEDKTI